MPCGWFSRQLTTPPSSFTRLRTPPSPSPCDHFSGALPLPSSARAQAEAAAFHRAHHHHPGGPGVVDAVADQLAQDARQRRPLHHAEHELLVMLEGPAQFNVRGGQALRDVGLPFGRRMRQRMVRCRQAAGERLQVLQRVAYIVLHLGALGLVHQRQQARADVVVQVLRDALALLGATRVPPLFHRPRRGAAGRARGRPAARRPRGEHALAAAGKAQCAAWRSLAGCHRRRRCAAAVPPAPSRRR